MPSSRVSSLLRDWTRVSCIAGESLPLSHQESLGSWMMAQRKHPGPNPWNVRMFIGKMDFAGVIQIRMLRWWSWINTRMLDCLGAPQLWSLCPYRRQGEEDLTEKKVTGGRRRKWSRRTAAPCRLRRWQRYPEPRDARVPWKRHGPGLLQGASEGPQRCWQLDCGSLNWLQTLTSRRVREVCAICTLLVYSSGLLQQEANAYMMLIYLYNKYLFCNSMLLTIGFPGGSVVQNPPANTGNVDSIPGSGRSPGEGNGNPLQYSCLQNPMDRGAWQATVQGVAKSQSTPSRY